ncbi:MAG TPA: hypothetical protein VHC22_23675 [Pirellulales bacterium]|nr:hypothetical protein [Pirellulales bacterium]
MPGNEAPVGPYMLYWGPPSTETPHGRPANQWRYRLHDGRWWYWGTDERWSYFNGDIWVPYTPRSDRELARASLLGPISGSFVNQGVYTRGKMAGLTMIPGDHPAAPHLKRGTVLPRYLNQEPLPRGDEEPAPKRDDEPAPQNDDEPAPRDEE